MRRDAQEDLCETHFMTKSLSFHAPMGTMPL
jgi:hypothetical protein